MFTVFVGWLAGRLYQCEIDPVVDHPDDMRQDEDYDYLLPDNIQHLQDTVDCQSSKVQLVKLINSDEFQYDYAFYIVYPEIIYCDSYRKHDQDYRIQNEMKP